MWLVISRTFKLKGKQAWNTDQFYVDIPVNRRIMFETTYLIHKIQIQELADCEKSLFIFRFTTIQGWNTLASPDPGYTYCLFILKV